MEALGTIERASNRHCLCPLPEAREQQFTLLMRLRAMAKDLRTQEVTTREIQRYRGRSTMVCGKLKDGYWGDGSNHERNRFMLSKLQGEEYCPGLTVRGYEVIRMGR